MPTRKPGRLSTDFLFSLFPHTQLPNLNPSAAAECHGSPPCPLLPAPIFGASHSSSLPNFPPSTCFFVPDSNSSRHSPANPRATTHRATRRLKTDPLPLLLQSDGPSHVPAL